MQDYVIDENGYYGEFGGAYIPEILHKCVKELEEAYLRIIDSPKFQRDFDQLLCDYVGRPSPLYHSPQLSERYGCKVYLKREDLNHTGAHKINNTIGQILIAREMGKTRIIAETGAGQHGVATATVCALMQMPCTVYMGKTDMERQRVNVKKMEMLGATVREVISGNMTLKDATNDAIRDWCSNPTDTHYIIGSVVGPHPYPDMVTRLQSVIGKEIKLQLLEKEGREYPDYLVACVGGGSNAAGTIHDFLDNDKVQILLAEAGGKGVESGETAATIHLGSVGGAARVQDTADAERGWTGDGALLHLGGTGLPGDRAGARALGANRAGTCSGGGRRGSTSRGIRANPPGGDHSRAGVGARLGGPREGSVLDR